MTFNGFFRAGMYLMLTLAVLSYSVDAVSDSRQAMLYPLASAIVGVYAILYVDSGKGIGLDRKTADWLAVGSVLLALLEYAYDQNLLLLSLAHWLFYLQTIKSLLVKSVEDDWFLMALSLVQALVSAVMSQSDAVGTILFAWSITSLWVLALFHLNREALRHVASKGASRRAVSAEVEGAYRGVISGRFVARNAGVVALSMLLGGGFFLLLPRRAILLRPGANRGASQHLTGFDEKVKLGQFGEILQNERVVMEVEVLDKHNRHVLMGDDRLWRGVTLGEYKSGAWSRKAKRRLKPNDQGAPPPSRTEFEIPQIDWNGEVLKQEIRLKQNDSPVLFTLCPAVEVETATRGISPIGNLDDGTWERSGGIGAEYTYVVYTPVNDDNLRTNEETPSGSRLAELLRIDPRDKVRFRTEADRMLGAVSPRLDRELACRKLERGLRDSGDYHYTLKMERNDRTIDPTLDFLINRKQGHCEYFASALALMLRAEGIPSRVVNGFKGGDWNELGQMMTIRQKHAHSWVEAFMGTGPKGLPKWLVLDPTPALERTAAIPNAGGFGEKVRELTDFLSWVWSTWIVGFDPERQNRLIYAPLKWLADESRAGFGIMWGAVKSLASGKLQWRELTRVFSLRGFSFSFISLLLLVLAVRALLWLFRFMTRWFRSGENDDSASAGVVFHRRLMRILGERGLVRAPSETPREFAARACESLHADPGLDTAAAETPVIVAEAYYRVAYGRRELGEDEMHAILEKLERLERSFKRSKQGFDSPE